MLIPTDTRHHLILFLKYQTRTGTALATAVMTHQRGHTLHQRRLHVASLVLAALFAVFALPCAVAEDVTFQLLQTAGSSDTPVIVNTTTTLAENALIERGGIEPLNAVPIPHVSAQNKIIGITLAGVVIFVAAGGGTGGGGVLDPIYILIMHLDPKVAIPLSSITIVGGSVANLILNIRKSRRNTREPLIDWDFVLVMQPMLLMGAGFGTFLNAILPSWLLCILLVIVLAITGKRTLKKAIQARKREHWGCCGDAPPERVTLIGAPSGYNASPGYSTAQSPVIPWRKVGYLFGLFAGVVVLNLIAGSPKYPSILGLSPGSFLYAIVSFFPTIFLIVYSHYAYKNIIATFYRQQNPRYVLSAGEIQWNPKSVQYFPLMAMGAGTVAGMFGIGGGIINAPLMLELGIEPTAAAAMTATTVLFSSSMSSFSYIMLGTLNFSLAKVLLPVGFVATLIGHVCLERAVQRFNCPSLIIFSMAIIVLTSAVAMSVESIQAIIS